MLKKPDIWKVQNQWKADFFSLFVKPMSSLAFQTVMKASSKWANARFGRNAISPIEKKPLLEKNISNNSKFSSTTAVLILTQSASFE